MWGCPLSTSTSQAGQVYFFPITTVNTWKYVSWFELLLMCIVEPKLKVVWILHTMYSKMSSLHLISLVIVCLFCYATIPCYNSYLFEFGLVLITRTFIVINCSIPTVSTAFFLSYTNKMVMRQNTKTMLYTYFYLTILYCCPSCNSNTLL